MQFVTTLRYGMRSLSLSQSQLPLSLAVNCVCLSLFLCLSGACWIGLSFSLILSLSLSLSLQLLAVLFIAYWECGCVCGCDPELVWSIRGVLSFLFDTRVRKKRDLHSTESSSEPSAFVTIMYLSQFLHWFAKIISLVLGLIDLLDQI